MTNQIQDQNQEQVSVNELILFDKAVDFSNLHFHH